jgi:antibiotic biosynthesis monooxygenase (ABM) superfamily enzyme
MIHNYKKPKFLAWLKQTAIYSLAIFVTVVLFFVIVALMNYFIGPLFTTIVLVSIVLGAMIAAISVF